MCKKKTFKEQRGMEGLPVTLTNSSDLWHQTVRKSLSKHWPSTYTVNNCPSAGAQYILTGILQARGTITETGISAMFINNWKGIRSLSWMIQTWSYLLKLPYRCYKNSRCYGFNATTNFPSRYSYCLMWTQISNLNLCFI